MDKENEMAVMTAATIFLVINFGNAWNGAAVSIPMQTIDACQQEAKRLEEMRGVQMAFCVRSR